MSRTISVLRSEIESALAGRISAPFTYRDRKVIETVSAGIAEIDSLTGGLPRGALTEICGSRCSGRTSVLISALASRTAESEFCAFVDGRDAFDPHSAEAAGVNLRQLLWVRCRDINQALRSTDLLLQAGGFGLIALDLADIPPEKVRYVPLNVWFRFRRAVEDTPTIFLVVEQEPHAKTCASLVLRMRTEAARWSQAIEDEHACFDRLDVTRNDRCNVPHARLFRGAVLSGEVVRSRVQAFGEVVGTSVYASSALANGASETAIFETKTKWSYVGAPTELKTKCPISR